MKREILFRGKQLSNGEFIEGSLTVDCHGNCCIYHPLNVPIVGGFQYFFVDPETVGQFTGMTDKNGTKIFEGDILKIVTFGFNTDEFITSIIWDRNEFKLANGRNLFYFGQSDYTKLDDSIVIGNIHDNKDLLK